MYKFAEMGKYIRINVMMATQLTEMAVAVSVWLRMDGSVMEGRRVQEVIVVGLHRDILWSIYLFIHVGYFLWCCVGLRSDLYDDFNLQVGDEDGYGSFINWEWGLNLGVKYYFLKSPRGVDWRSGIFYLCEEIEIEYSEKL